MRVIVALPLLAGPAALAAQASSHSHSYHRSSTHSHGLTRHYTWHRPSAAVGRRDEHGRIKRSAAAKGEFERETGHPHGWPGHVVDHVVPLACGGADAPSNMQWQTTAKAKDRVERQGSRR